VFIVDPAIVFIRKRQQTGLQQSEKIKIKYYISTDLSMFLRISFLVLKARVTQGLMVSFLVLKARVTQGLMVSFLVLKARVTQDLMASFLVLKARVTQGLINGILFGAEG